MATSISNQQRRIEVRVPPSTSFKQERELVAFARYCVQRIERDLGEQQQWSIDITLGARGYAAHVDVLHCGAHLEARGTGNDGALAIWDVMCSIEQALRERPGLMFLSRPRVAND